ncbi:hypothetical protein SDC9_135736 [bioreactor metagenome]|uniref:EamA domain-containing protein n=1 Tax=bioreactor metagenome TaxID=1076179 RepID=A0A645DJ73_9ZZZZ
MVALLYLGAGAGMLLLRFFSHERRDEAPLSRQEMPWTISMILLDVIAPFLLLRGLELTTAANASLLFNAEMVVTSLIALAFFHEAIGKRMWFAIGVITLGSILLSIDFNNISAWKFSPGSLLVLAACGCWGMENNCTRNMSAKSPAQIVIVKGLGSGLTALLIAVLLKNPFPQFVVAAMLTFCLGFVAYGLSIFFYVKAQRYLGAARTSAYYAAAPFMGVLLAMLILKEVPSWNFMMASVFMLLGAWLVIRELHSHGHRHEKLMHNHAHCHDNQHHAHVHSPPVAGWHTHEHVHAEFTHEHSHTPDIHHRHSHFNEPPRF